MPEGAGILNPHPPLLGEPVSCMLPHGGRDMRANGSRAGGIVLAGGRSRRMGSSKADLPLGDATMLTGVIDAVRHGLPDGAPIVVVAAPDLPLPRLPPNLRVVTDVVADQGPLRGLESGLAALATGADFAYVSSCDVPLLRPAFIARMLELSDGWDIAVPVTDGRPHPMAAVYRTDLLGLVRELLAAGGRRPAFLFERTRTRRVEASELTGADPRLDSLRNVNTPEEYDALQAEVVVAELYGPLRLAAGREEVPVAVHTLGEALAEVEAICPSLVGRLGDHSGLAPHVRVAVNGRAFVDDPDLLLAPGDRLVLIPAAAGG